MKKHEMLSLPPIGGSALLVSFAVLCLTVLALLSLSTVLAERRLSDAAAEAAVAYYEADLQAETVFAKLRAGETVPEVTVTDTKGNAVAMSYDPDTRTYAENFEIADIAISQDEYDFVLEATKTYFRFMLNDTGSTQLRQYFDSASQTYKTIIKSEDPWLQDFRTYDFGTEKIYDFCRYGDDLSSVRIAMDLNVTRTNGTIKTFSVDTTFFLERSGRAWKIIDMTNVDVTQVLTQVRMTYLQDGKQLSTQMVSTDVTALKLPSVVAPEGKVLAGWFLQEVNEKGDITYSRMFMPGEDGSVKLPAGYVLEPMELHVLFEEAK